MTAPAQAYPGHLAYEYLNLGTKAAPTWAQIKRAEDIDISNERENTQIFVKGEDLAKAIVGGKKLSVAFKYRLKKATDAVYTELKAAYDDASLVVEFAAMDGDMATSGSAGFSGPFQVTKFSESRPYNGPVEVDVELQFADADDPEAAGTDWALEAITVA